LGGLAAAVTLRKEPSVTEKACWIIAMTLIMAAEIHNLYVESDKQRNQAQIISASLDATNKGLNETLEGLTSVASNLGALSSGMDTANRTNQSHFDTTMNQFSTAQQQQQQQFKDTLNGYRNLFEHEQQLAESLRGTLFPASDPMSATPNPDCLPRREGEIVAFFGDHYAFVERFLPHTVMTIHGKDVIRLNRDRDGVIYLQLDIKDAAQKVIARLDSRGWRVNRNVILAVLRPDVSTLIIEDEYGSEVLTIRYMNPSAIKINGIMHVEDRTIDLSNPGRGFGLNIGKMCSYYSGIEFVVP
jgi:hypothetical protein